MEDGAEVLASEAIGQRRRDGESDRSVMTAAASSLFLLAAATAAVVVCCLMIMMPTTTTGNFVEYFQVPCAQFGQRLPHGDGVCDENAGAAAAQVVEHSAADAASTNDGIDVLWCRAARAGSGRNAEALAADAINDQQGRRGSKTREDLGIETIQLGDRHADFQLNSLGHCWKEWRNCQLCLSR